MAQLEQEAEPTRQAKMKESASSYRLASLGMRRGAAGRSTFLNRREPSRLQHATLTVLMPMSDLAAHMAAMRGLTLREIVNYRDLSRSARDEPTGGRFWPIRVRLREGSHE